MLRLDGKLVPYLAMSIRRSAMALSLSTPPTELALSDVDLVINSRTPSCSRPLARLERPRASRSYHFSSAADGAAASASASAAASAAAKNSTIDRSTHHTMQAVV